MSDTTPLPRWSNATGDVIITCQLVTQAYFLLKRSPSSDLPATRISFYLYRLNVILASFFTLIGAYLHVMDPVPTTSTLAWKLFLVTLASTPILFPIALQFALFPTGRKSPVIAYFLFSLFSHLSLILLEFDIAPYLPPFFFKPLTLPGFGIIPDATLDGRSIGGAPYNIPVDYLSSVPCYHGSSVFPHCILFTIAAVYSLVLTRTAPGCPSGLRQALNLMVFGQLTMVPILVFSGIQWCFDIWHVNIFIVMQLVYMNLPNLVAPHPALVKSKKV